MIAWLISSIVLGIIWALFGAKGLAVLAFVAIMGILLIMTCIMCKEKN